MKVTIKKSNQAYVNYLAKELNCCPAETIDYLLKTLQLQGFTLTGNTFVAQSKEAVRLYQELASSEFSTESKIDIFSDAATEIDPVLDRLIKAGIEDF